MALLRYMQAIPRRGELPANRSTILLGSQFSSSPMAASQMSNMVATNATLFLNSTHGSFTRSSYAPSDLAHVVKFNGFGPRAKINLAKYLRHTIHLAKVKFSPGENFPLYIFNPIVTCTVPTLVVQTGP